MSEAKASTEAVKERVSKMDIEATEDEKGIKMVFSFPNGKSTHFLLFPEHPLYKQFAVHGINKKVRDTLAVISDPDEALKVTEGILEAFNNGNWNAKRNAPPEGHDQGLLVRALNRLTGKSLEASATYVNGLDKAKQAAMRDLPDIARLIVELKQEDLARKPNAKRPDAQALLGDFLSPSEEHGERRKAA